MLSLSSAPYISSKMEIYLRKLPLYLRIIRFIDFSTKILLKKLFFIKMQQNCQKKYQKILIRKVKLC